MASLKGKIIRLFSSVALKRGTVADVQDFGGFRRMLLRCDVEEIPAGTKVQILLPSDDVRTYTPIHAPEGMVLLGWKKAGGPGAQWMATAGVGEVLPFVGPQHSLELDAGPVIIVGDETSVAVAAAFSAERPGQVRAVIQSDAAADVRAVAGSVSLHGVDVVARGDVTATLDAITSGPTASAIVALTGGSELVVGVRAALRQAGVQNLKTKTYWVPGKTGLD